MYEFVDSIQYIHSQIANTTQEVAHRGQIPRTSVAHRFRGPPECAGIGPPLPLPSRSAAARRKNSIGAAAVAPQPLLPMAKTTPRYPGSWKAFAAGHRASSEFLFFSRELCAARPCFCIFTLSVAETQSMSADVKYLLPHAPEHTKRLR